MASTALVLALVPLGAACGAQAMPPEAATGGDATTAGGQQRPAPRARAAAGVRLVSVGRFDQPLLVTAARDDWRRLYVVEQGGRIVVVRNGRRLARPFLDIRRKVRAAGEQGLLGLAFAPDFATSRRLYVYYTNRTASRNLLVEYRAASRDRAAAGSARTVLSMPNLEPNHNGGNLVFGPDGLLYVGTGDGGGANDQHGRRGNAQDLGSLLGKILRIDPRPSGGRPYRVPRSNPFVGRPGARGEVYAYGLRNPWRFSFDRATGDLTIGDVGQDAVEEIDFAPKGQARGANYGWRPFEGNRRLFDEPAPRAVAPVITHFHEAFCSITGGFVVRDRGVPALYGRYVYGDLCQSRLWAARLAPGRATGDGPLSTRRVDSVASFGEDARGRVYVVSLSGPVYRFAAR